MSKRGLGRGLGALIPDSGQAERDTAQEVEISRVRPNPKQPRRIFDEEKLDELAASIREHGVVQPILVRPVESGYELVAGERRWRAAQRVGLEKIPAIVREFTPEQVMEIALIENLQREDLNPLEEAEAYRTLIEEFKLTQEELARRLGRSRPQISNTLRLLNLPPEVQQRVAAGALSMGHAKVLLGVTDPNALTRLAAQAERESLSVRELEALVAREGAPEGATGKRTNRKADVPRDAQLVHLEDTLRERLGTPVRIVPGSPKGKLEIYFYGDEDLSRIYDLLLGVEPPTRTLRLGSGPFPV